MSQLRPLQRSGRANTTSAPAPVKLGRGVSYDLEAISAEVHEQIHDTDDGYDEYEYQEEEVESEKPSLSIPRVRKQDAHDDDDGLLSPRRVFQQVDAFSQMLDSGAGWGSALVAAVQGHKMTEEQAALCIQSHWRKKAVYNENRYNGMAADFIINVWRKRQWRQHTEAAKEHSRAQLAYYEQMEAEANAATAINSAWRGHMDRERVKVLRARAKGGVGSAIRRSLSFGKKKGGGGGGGGGVARAATAVGDDEKKAGIGKRIKRSLSFDRKGGGGIFGGSGKEDEPQNKVAKCSTRLSLVLERGPQGLGLELDRTNTVTLIKPGGRAERQGLMCVGDTVLKVDGKSCAGKLMSDVMTPGQESYMVDVSRPEMVQAAVPTREGANNLSTSASTRSTRRTFVVERGPQGLGLELDLTNTVALIKPGGRAEQQGLICVGDTVLTIDGKSCAGKLMSDVMTPGRQCYVIEVSRPDVVQAAPPTPSGLGSKIMRSMSFDKKSTGGIKRSYSFTNRKR